MEKTHLQKQKKGFTLIEVIIVVAIIGILSAMVTPALLNIIGSSQAKAISSYGKQYFVGAQTAVTNVNIAIRTGVTTTPFTVKEIKSIYYVDGDNCIFYPGGAGDVKKITTDVALAKSQPQKYTVIPPLPASIPDFSGKTGMGLNPDVSPYIPANSANDNAVLLKNAMQPLLVDPIKAENGGFLTNVKINGTITPPTPPNITTENPIIVSIYNTKTTNPTGTFIGRAYAMKVANIKYGINYEILQDKNVIGEFNLVKGDIVDLTGKLTYPQTDPIAAIQIREKDKPKRASNVATRDLSFYYGNGTYKISPNDAQDGTDNFYPITDPESLQALSTKVKIDNANFATKNYKQIVTIDMAKGYKTPTTFEKIANFTPIGSDVNLFRGTYDGGAKLDGTGYEIINLTINLPNGENVALFGVVENATLKNIGIGEGSSITGDIYVAGIAGMVASNSTITNVYNKANIGGGQSTSSMFVAGIAAMIDDTSSITNAYNTGNIVGSAAVGGIVGGAIGSISNVYNTGSVNITSSGKFIGGIVGYLFNTGADVGSITNAYNTGTIVSSADLVGGIIGFAMDSTDFSNVYNIGNVTGKDRVGGVIGGTSFYRATPRGTNTKFKKGIIVKGTPDSIAQSFNTEYTNISEFVNDTGWEANRWNDKGQLLNADGTLMGGPNPGDQTLPLPIITVKSTATTNPTGTFIGRAYAADISKLTSGKAYTVKLFAPNSKTAYETINFTPTATTHTLNLTGKFTPTMDGANGVHTIAVYDGAKELVTTTRDISFYYGNGTYKLNPDDVQNGAEDFYAISDPESLQALSAKVKIDNANFATKNYKQIATVDMAKGYKTPTTFEQVANFTPIGDQPNPFKGSYNGGAKADRTGFEIRNLKITGNANDGNIGLFGGGQGVTLKNIGIGAGSVISGYNRVGAIIGRVWTNVPSTLTNCYNLGSVSASADGGLAGGLFGSIQGGPTIDQCYNAGSVTAKGRAGGIAGDISGNGELKNSYNTGSITGSLHLGGIVGRLASTNVTNCYNTGTLRADIPFTNGGIGIGGIVGYLNNANVIDVYNTGSISDSGVANNFTDQLGIGGIVGRAQASEGIVIENSYNAGPITSSATISANSLSYLSGIGGILGALYPHSNDNTSIINSTNRSTGTIITKNKAGAPAVGGIAGSTNSTNITGCTNDAQLEGGLAVGGIVGITPYRFTDLANISTCVNNGTIIGTDNVGGIVGEGEGVHIVNTNNTGNIRGNNNVGGIIGFAHDNTKAQSALVIGSIIDKCTNSGAVNGTSFIGGIAGSLANSKIVDSSNSAKIEGITFIGGIVGRAANYDTLNYRSYVSYSSNTGPITGTQYIGGIAGLTIRGDIEYSYNTAKITGAVTGGITGQATGRIDYCYNTGLIQGTGNYLGGIAGLSYDAGSIVTNCYNTGIVNGSTFVYVGGAIGQSGESTINIYSTTNIVGSGGVGRVIGQPANNGQNLRYKASATISAPPGSESVVNNVAYTNISEFINATGASRSRWDTSGRLLKPDGTLMAGPNPGGN